MMAFVNTSFAEVRIVKDGEPSGAIVVGCQCSTQAKHAAQELQRYIKQISGASLAIVETAGPVIIFMLAPPWRVTSSANSVW